MKRRMHWAIWAVLLVMSVGLAGCGAGAKSGDVPLDAPLGDQPPAAQPVPTGAAGVASTPITPMGNTADWAISQHNEGGLSYSYLYPPGWTTDLSYCAPGAARTATGSELPGGCVATDILLGQKALDIGTLTGDSLTINGKQAVRQISDNPRSSMASSIYTLMLYDATGAPLLGFSSSIGPGTDEAIRNNITSTLDKIAATLTVGR